MKLTIGQVSKHAGISVRTLHYYDEIGLLHPVGRSESGYRYYDRESLRKLQQILFFRELGFALSQIAEILSRPNYNPVQALKRQRELLQMKRERLDALIAHMDEILQGGHEMDFQAFDKTNLEREMERYYEEAKERYGNTPEFAQSERRTGAYSKKDWNTMEEEAEKIFSTFAALRECAPDDEKVQAMVKLWQGHITKYYYPCTKEILCNLGQMYLEDERFTENLDRYGKGTAKLMSLAIAYYCR